ncbi:MAG TPA: right-handed parallel beta-helix repeat-containing protein [Pirellulales bacterium]|jgi:hypothetical protein|nr:right-handed parallel beta-helix repeat-containing protein [Pirellulales bacterium]
MRALTVVVIVLSLVGPAAAEPGKSGIVSVADFLPANYVTDGSVSYQEQLQKAIDAVGPGGTLVFPPMVYRLDEAGLRIKSRMTLSMYGAAFVLDEKASKDGQAFLGENLKSVQFLGGEIVGRNDTWADGVNIRGIYLSGSAENIRIRDMNIHDLSSNGIGLFAMADAPARDVWVTDTVVDHCCNKYGDYVSAKPGPEKGSKRDDQGSICFYYVNDWLVAGCRFERSRSDGTHFYRCKQGQFVDNKVYGAQMGGYFIETCDDVVATGNVIRDNGSRGATIERGSRNCILKGNVIAASGREGLWAPNCVGLIVTGNVFDTNGRKPNGTKPTHIWNANITINGDPYDPSKSSTENYIVADNLITTTAEQIAAIRVDTAAARGIALHNNMLRGENRQVLVQGPAPEQVTNVANE